MVVPHARRSVETIRQASPFVDGHSDVAEVAQGRTNAEIADHLYISLSTVKTHIASLMTKLSARNRVEIAMWAHETGRMR